MKVTFLATGKIGLFYLLYSTCYIKIYIFRYMLYLEYRRSLVSIFRCAFVHFSRFFNPPFLYLMMIMVHDQHVYFSDMYLPFIYF